MHGMYIQIKIKKENYIICAYKNIACVVLITQNNRHHEAPDDGYINAQNMSST